jgi:hypothetical protein
MKGREDIAGPMGERDASIEKVRPRDQPLFLNPADPHF